MSEGAGVDRTERLLNLVLCLLDAPRPVDRATIRSVVPGYSSSASAAAFERMFERDKEELRGMGIPIDTVESANGEILGYRIDPAEYGLAEVSASAADLAVLGLAARAFSEASLGARARAALRKIEAVSEAVAPGPSARIDLIGSPAPSDTHLPELWEGVRTRRVVAFDYRRPDQPAASPRTVEPWGVVARDGGWYLVGRDVDRDAPRVFRTSRMGERVSLAGAPAAFAVPDVDIRQLVLGDPESMAAASTTSVRVALDPGRGDRIRLRGREVGRDGDRIVVDIEVVDPAAIVAEVLALGGAAEILAPEAVRDSVRAGFAYLVDAHDAGPGEPA